MGKTFQQILREHPKSKLVKYDYILKKGEDADGNIFYKIKWKDLSKEDSSYEPIENLSLIKKEIREYDINYLKSIRDLEVVPKKVNFIKKINNKYYCNVLFQRCRESERNTYKQQVVANLYIKYNVIRMNYPKLLINYFELYYKE